MKKIEKCLYEDIVKFLTKRNKMLGDISPVQYFINLDETVLSSKSIESLDVDYSKNLEKLNEYSLGLDSMYDITSKNYTKSFESFMNEYEALSAMKKYCLAILSGCYLEVEDKEKKEFYYFGEIKDITDEEIEIMDTFNNFNEVEFLNYIVDLSESLKTKYEDLQITSPSKAFNFARDDEKVEVRKFFDTKSFVLEKKEDGKLNFDNENYDFITSPNELMGGYSPINYFRNLEYSEISLSNIEKMEENYTYNLDQLLKYTSLLENIYNIDNSVDSGSLYETIQAKYDEVLESFISDYEILNTIEKAMLYAINGKVFTVEMGYADYEESYQSSVEPLDDEEIQIFENFIGYSEDELVKYIVYLTESLKERYALLQISSGKNVTVLLDSLNKENVKVKK